MIGSTIIVDNNVAPDAFPFITQAPAGMPGNTNVFAQTQQPRLFSGSSAAARPPIRREMNVAFGRHGFAPALASGAS